MAKPKIRFKGYTDDWEQRKLGETCKLNGRIGFRGYTERDIVTKEAGGVLTFSPTNIVNNKLTMECKNTYITREKYDESPEIKIANGDILFVKTGSTLGKSALVTGLKEDASINPQIVVMRVEKDSETFMSNVLITHGIMKQVAAVKIGGAVPTMTETELKNLTYFAPVQKEEQKKIGDYFTNLDHFITLHQRKCEETKKLKKYMLQKMFPKNGQTVPEIRFAGFTDAWEQRKFGDDNDLITGYPFESEKFSEEGIKLVRGMNVKRGYLDFSNDICMRWNSTDGLENYLLEADDILIQMDGALIGKSYAKIAEEQLPALLVQRVTRARTRSKDACTDFMYQTIQRDFLRYIGMNKTETAVPHLSLNDIYNFKIMVPCLEEQQQIGAYFSNIDNLITLHQHKCEQLQSMKKFMLQNMFV